MDGQQGDGNSTVLQLLQRTDVPGDEVQVTFSRHGMIYRTTLVRIRADRVQSHRSAFSTATRVALMIFVRLLTALEFQDIIGNVDAGGKPCACRAKQHVY